MTREEVSKIIIIIKSNYPNHFNNLTQSDLSLVIETWNIQFKNETFSNVYKALMYWISINHYPPYIANLKNVIYEMMNDNKLLNPEQAWEMVLKSSRNNRDNAIEEFYRLPSYIQQAISIETLVQIGNANKENLIYIKRDFLKSYQGIQESHKREYQISSVSNSIKELDTKKDSSELIENPKPLSIT